jgi:cell division protein FtsI (penicillin-binding protein 3)
MVVVARLVQVQVIQARSLKDEARRQQEHRQQLPAARGAILDREGTPLAITLPGNLRERTEPSRLYPEGTTGAHVVGFCMADGRGAEGLEERFDELVRGIPGERTVGRDGRGLKFSASWGTVQDPKDGATLHLTLDTTTQSVLERELRRTVERTGARSASGLFMDPRTGDILAMGCWPGFDPGRYAASEWGARRNRIVTDRNEPGSTFKVVTVAAALEEGLATPSTLLESSLEMSLAGGSPLHDKEDYGWVTVEETIAQSINTATARLARRVGRNRLYEYARAFGFGCITGIDLPGEVSGTLRRPADWSGRSLESIAIGQEVSVTMVQLACAYSSIANGGLLMKPRIVREVRAPNGSLVRSFRPRAVRRVISRSTAESLTAMLAAVVCEGTGTEAAIPGLRVCGKTGTAQYVDPRTGRYDPRRHIASFVGYLPAERPTLVGAIMVEAPRGVGYGGSIAAPCFRRVVEGSILALRQPGELATVLSNPEEEKAG